MQGKEVHGATSDEQNRDSRDPETLDNPDEGPTMTGVGAEPGGNSMDHWNTAMPNADATKPETMPKAVGGTEEAVDQSDKSNPT